MRYTGIVRKQNGKSGMIHYNMDLGNIDGLCCIGGERKVIEKGHFSISLSYDKEGFKCWNENGVQLQIKVWDFKENENLIKIEERNESRYNSVEADLNLSSEEDFDNLINSIQQLKEIFIQSKNEQ